MAFLNNAKFKEIREAAKNGNEKAAMVLQALIKGKQEDVERLVDAYYKVETETEGKVYDSKNNAFTAVCCGAAGAAVFPGIRKCLPESGGGDYIMG